MAKYSRPEQKPKRNSPPASTPEGRENQLISMAMDLAEKRMRNETASAQEVTHFLKLGSLSARAERNILEKQMELLEAKTEAIRSSRRVDELYSDAIAAMRSYGGNSDSDQDRDSHEN